MSIKTEEPVTVVHATSKVAPHGQTDFDSVADDYDDSLPHHVMDHYQAKRVGFIKQHAQPGSKVLDVGCGTGVLAEALVNEGYAVTGLDPFQGMLKHVKQRVPELETVHGSGENLPFADDTFDFTYCVAVMHHVAEKGNVLSTLKEMARVTKPGGKIMVWDHNPRNPYWPYLMRRVPQDTGAERLIPDSEIVSGLAAGGAVTFFNRPLGMMPDFTPPKLVSFMAKVESVIENVPILKLVGAHNVIVAIKQGHS
ncbi:MAG: methyltransferase domain-containing protein [Thermomicrobiales bacterium]